MGFVKVLLIISMFVIYFIESLPVGDFDKLDYETYQDKVVKGTYVKVEKPLLIYYKVTTKDKYLALIQKYPSIEKIKVETWLKKSKLPLSESKKIIKFQIWSRDGSKKGLGAP